MDSDLDILDDQRIIELSTIAASFPELIIDPENPFVASLQLSVEPLKPLAVSFAPLAARGPPGNLATPPSSTRGGVGPNASEHYKSLESAEDVHHIAYLPSLHVRLDLLDGYPSKKPPALELSTEPPWLPGEKTEQLRGHVEKLWENVERDQVVFYYIDYLQQEAEAGFNLIRYPTDTLKLPQHMKLALLDHESKEKRARFERQTFDCGICLEPKKGSVCYRLLLCGHVYCVTCLQNFYNSCITEGDLTMVKCPDPSCGKDPNTTTSQTTPTSKSSRRKDRTLEASEILQIPLEYKMVQRYVKLKRKKLLESDKTTVWCPRSWCQGAARSKKYPKNDINLQSLRESHLDEADEEGDESPAADSTEDKIHRLSPEDRLAVCEDCGFAFCKICQKSWHGAYKLCLPRRKVELTAEEKASEEYLLKHGTRCFQRLWELEGGDDMVWDRNEGPVDHEAVLEFEHQREHGELVLVEFVNGRPQQNVQVPENRRRLGRHARAAREREAAARGGRIPPPPGVRVNPRRMAGLVRPPPVAPQPPAGGRVNEGLQLFLDMARNDAEDGWDSEEEFGEDEAWRIPGDWGDL
ncbi:translation termination inhibitor protein itt1 [Bachmanniomyces sp. S44760]|nr:translation termination inhibitor protein itt1 [Bachmanniomyces sp. S44760]